MSFREPLGLRTAAARRGLLGYGAAFSLAAAVGILAGLGALAFRWAEHVIQGWTVGEAGSLTETVTHVPVFARLVLPAAGILLAAVIVRKVVGTQDPGIDAMEAVALRRGPMTLRKELARVLAALGVIGTGGSVGPEGPIVELGAALGSGIASRTRQRRRAVSLLGSCGAAGGLAAAFNAPIGASIFVLEIMIGRLSVGRFAPVVVASVSATLVSQAAYGRAPVFHAADLRLASSWEMVAVVVLGILGGLLGAVFLRLLDVIQETIRKVKWPFWVHAIAGGLTVGAIGLWFPQVLGAGFDAINAILRGDFGLGLLMGLLVAKIIATSVTLGPGGMGGVFAPTLMLGAALGGAVGLAVNQFFPGAGHPGAYALVGMASLVGATLHAPVTAILLTFELSRDYELVPHLMLATIIATVIARRLHPWSLYAQKLRKRGVRAKSGGELLLATATVGDTMEPVPPTLDVRASINEVVACLEREHEGEVYVTRPGGILDGWIRSEDLAGVAVEGLEDVAVAEDLVRSPAWVTSEATLGEALRILDASGQDEAPVLSSAEEGRMLGILTRRAVLRRLRSG
ncbi:MAG: chloride channel protein [Planctomycetota bacterium]|jgi:CIC family chloride channel protein